MRFVPAKTPEQQSCLMLHRTRHLFIRQQAAVINAVRTHLAEFGMVAPVDKHDTSGGAQRFLCDVPITRPAQAQRATPCSQKHNKKSK
jgi:transposase